MAHLPIFLSLLLTLANLNRINAVNYVVKNQAENTPGGIRFNNELGVEYTKQTMASATDFIWRIFQQNTEADRKNVPIVSLFIKEMDGVAETILGINEIHVSAQYIAGFQGDIRQEFNGVLYHEMTHIWQWIPSNVPIGLIEGIADFVRLKANYVPSHWVQPGQGNRWDQGYDVTARFLDYCNGLSDGFVAELNNRMRNGYSDNFFVELLGETVDQLWNDYKAQFQMEHKYSYGLQLQ